MIHISFYMPYHEFLNFCDNTFQDFRIFLSRSGLYPFLSNAPSIFTPCLKKCFKSYLGQTVTGSSHWNASRAPLRGCILPSSKKSAVNLWSPYQPCIHAHNGYYLLCKREHYCRKSLLACGHLCKASISCLGRNSTALLQSQYLLTETLVKFELFQLLLNKNMSKHFLNFSFKLAKACHTS